MADQTLRFEISGMSCAGCAGRAERALSAIPGVSQASVNLANHTGQITGDPGAAPVRDALAKAGYPAREEVIRLAISGMSCASCSARVERALSAAPGVLGASVNLASEAAEVRILPMPAIEGESTQRQSAVQPADRHPHGQVRPQRC